MGQIKIGSAVGTQLYNFLPPTPTLSPKTLLLLNHRHFCHLANTIQTNTIHSQYPVNILPMSSDDICCFGKLKKMHRHMLCLILPTVLGTQTAYAWVRCGHRTLDDLRAVESTVTRCQRIGLKYYDELLDRMPRTEAAEIEATVMTFL